MKNNDKNILIRPRLNTLIQEGLQYPMLILLAGTGYGKTEAMIQYLHTREDKTVWMQLSSLDGLPSYFWNHLVRVMSSDFSELATQLQKLGFPDTVSKFDAFVQLISKYIDNQKKLILVFDDFNTINDTEVYSLFEMMSTLILPDFHFVLISNLLTSTDSVAFLSSRQFLILTKDLRFSKDEISQLYQMNGFSLKNEELETIENYTEGWPLAINLLVQKHNTMSTTHIIREKHLDNVISDIFEDRFFATYSHHQQILLVQLSLVNFFTQEFMTNLYRGNTDELDIFKNNVFIRNEYSTGHYFFHHIYRIFLKRKQYLLNEVEKKQIWREAAEYYEAADHTIKAITFYQKCDDYMNILDLIKEYIKSGNDITLENAPFFLENLDMLTLEETKAQPISEYLRALIYLLIFDFTKAETILINLKNILLKNSSSESFALLGEVYASLGSIHILRNQEDFVEFYKKAVQYLPEGSNFCIHRQLSTRISHCFVLPDNQPGSRKRMEQATHEGMPFIQRFFHGFRNGTEHFFSAEAAYLSYELEKAKQHAYHTIYKAETSAQHNLVCNSYGLLARIGLMQGNYKEMTQQIENINQYAKKFDDNDIKEIQNTVLDWYYIKLHDNNQIMKNTQTMNIKNKPIWTHFNSQIIYAYHLIHTNKYAQLVGMLEYKKDLQLIQGICPDRITLFIMLAIGYYHLGNSDASTRSLWTAYDMSYHNGLTTLFIEAENNMLALIEQTYKQNTYKFESEWLNLIYHETLAFTKRANAVRTAYHKKNTALITDKSNILSKREREVLTAISKGLTREEIAVEQYISVNTVKSTIRNIYNKLNANNKADAVSIAITHGYIEGYKAE